MKHLRANIITVLYNKQRKIKQDINCLFLIFSSFYDECKRRYTIKLWKTFTDCFNCLPVAAIGNNNIYNICLNLLLYNYS